MLYGIKINHGDIWEHFPYDKTRFLTPSRTEIKKMYVEFKEKYAVENLRITKYIESEILTLEGWEEQ